MPRCDITIKLGTKTLTSVQGRVDISDVSLAEAGQIVMLEDKLEELTGYRYHIDLKGDNPIQGSLLEEGS